MNLVPELRRALTWHPHVDVWATVVILAVGYAYAVRRIGPYKVSPGEDVVTRRQAWQWYTGVGMLWAVSDWPFHDLAEKSMYSAHMIEHLVIVFVAAPLLLMGTPAWLARMLVVETGLLGLVRWAAKPVRAFIIFNLVFIGLHWPLVVDGMVTEPVVHFLVHLAMFLSALVMWMPVLSPLPEVEKLARPMQMLYLMGHSVLPILPASFLTFGTSVIYPVYETFPRLFGWSALDDQTIAGIIMKIAGSFTLWIVIAVIWFRWAAEQEEDEQTERLQATGKGPR